MLQTPRSYSQWTSHLSQLAFTYVKLTPPTSSNTSTVCSLWLYLAKQLGAVLLPAKAQTVWAIQSATCLQALYCWSPESYC